MKHKFKTRNQFITNLLDWTITALIGAALAVLMIGMILGAAVQEQNKLSQMAASEVCE